MISTLQKVKSQLQLIDSTTNKTSNYVYRGVIGILCIGMSNHS
jgi:hypothetical protein